MDSSIQSTSSSYNIVQADTNANVTDELQVHLVSSSKYSGLEGVMLFLIGFELLHLLFHKLGK